MVTDERFMRRVLELAATPPWTSPNPRVGCVIERDGAIVSEGHHAGPGTPHAEAIALKGVDAAGATLYVNLEPCAHFGKMPPCAPAVAEAGVKRVVIAQLDPDDRVSGRGAEFLRSSGVEVSVGLLEREARLQNAPYLHHRTTGRAFLTLKLALSLDGRLSAADGSSQWITGESARTRVQARRAEADAVMVGAGTVLADDPSLSARPVDELRQPLRILVDGRGRIPANAKTFSLPGQVIVAATRASKHEAQIGWKESGAEVLALGGDDGRVDLLELLSELGRRSVVEVICEGGGKLATSLLAEDLVDRLELLYGPLMLGSGGSEVGPIGVETIQQGKRFALEHSERLGDDVLLVLGRSA